MLVSLYTSRVIIYIYSKTDLPLIKDYMNHGCGFDAPGNLARDLCCIVDMYAWQMSGTRFDIGSLDTYEEAKRKYSNKHADGTNRS